MSDDTEDTFNPDDLSPRFTDAQGREWHLELDFAKLRAIRSQFRVDLGDVEQFAKTWADLLFRDEKLLDVVWAALADRAGDVTADDWLAAMAGEQLEAAQEALLAAIYLFTRPLKRGLIEEGAMAVQKMYRRAIREAKTEIQTAVSDATTRALSALGTKRPKSRASSVAGTTAGRSGKRTKH